ncbi:hypothetical protein AB6D09_006630 [Vibrio cyclitrophicus]
MNILYVTDNLISSSVFKSQVDNICNAHSEFNEVKVLAFCKPKDLNYTNESRYELIKFMRLPLFSIEPVATFIATMFYRKELFDWADIIHCRGHGPMLMASKLLDKYSLDKKIIFDVRGAVVNEIREAKSNRVYQFISDKLKITEEQCFKRADSLFYVSDSMRVHFSSLYDIKCNNAIIPTIVNEKYFKPMPDMRDEIRCKEGFEGKFVYVYSGGKDYWQNLDLILKKFSQMIKLDSNIVLLLLVIDLEYLNKLIVELGICRDNIVIKSLEYEDVGKYLNASDAGLIIRSNSIVNLVASPTKINEYVACGLKIVDSLDEIGNLEYNANYLSENYMPLHSAIERQCEVYRNLIK